MAATVSIFVDKGATPTEVDVGSGGFRFRTDDSPDTVDNTSPIPIPNAGTKYSFWVHLFMKITGGTPGTINNVKFYTSGAAPLYGDAGVTLKVGDGNQTKNSGSTAGYDEPSGNGEVIGDTGVELTNHANVASSTDGVTHTPASPRDVNISEAGAVMDAAGETTDYVILQLEVSTTATAGDTASETLTFRYDEV